MPLSYSQITAIAQNTIDKTLTDNVFNATPVLARLRQKSKKYSGGVKIQVPVIASSSTSGGWFTDLDTLNITRTDNISAAVYDWRQAFESVRISKLDLAKCSGDAAKLDLVASKIKVAEAAMADRLSQGIFSSGGSNKIDGFQAVISATTTYGEIAVADMASWKAQVLANGGTPRALTLALLQKLDGACTNGKESPSLFIAKQNAFDEVYNLYTPYQRIESEEVGKMGFKSLMVNGKPLVVDAAMKSGSIYAINEDFVHMAIHKDNDMRKEHHESLETSDSALTKVFFMGNIVCSARKYHGELADITVV